MNNLLWETFKESGQFGQLILVILFIASILIWTIILHKAILFRRIRRGGEELLKRFQRVKQGAFSLTFTPVSSELDPVYAVYRRGCQELAYLNENSSPAGKEVWDRLEETLQRTADEQVLVMRKNLIFLATAASTGPLLGILGTVWGVLVAFRGMGQYGSATIDAVAPGISEALITTVFGLIVAIPALIAYNYFNHVIGKFAAGLNNFIGEFLEAARKHRPEGGKH